MSLLLPDLEKTRKLNEQNKLKREGSSTSWSDMQEPYSDAFKQTFDLGQKVIGQSWSDMNGPSTTNTNTNGRNLTPDDPEWHRSAQVTQNLGRNARGIFNSGMPSINTDGAIWNPSGYTQDPMQFDTHAPDPGSVPNFPFYLGDGGPNNVTQQNGDSVYNFQRTGNPNSGLLSAAGAFTQLNPDGSVRPGDVNPLVREVTAGESTAEQLHQLLNSDSKFIHDARRQGLEQANSVGGLGGTVGTGASMQAAIRSGLPIAESDAQAYRQAATENLASLNQFSLMNAQRASQLELANIDAGVRQTLTQITTTAQLASDKLASATQRDLGRLDSETRLRLGQIQGQIQARLADINYRHTAILNDQQNKHALQQGILSGEYQLASVGLGGMYDLEQANLQGMFGLEGTTIGGEYDLAGQQYGIDQQVMMQRETNHVNMAAGAYDSYLNRIAELNGVEMDDAARQRAISTITTGFHSHMDLINSLFPEFDPIQYGT